MPYIRKSIRKIYEKHLSPLKAIIAIASTKGEFRTLARVEFEDPKNVKRASDFAVNVTSSPQVLCTASVTSAVIP